jgi:hypothetical protein
MILESYQELSERHRTEFEALPIIFAFNNKQMKEGLESIGLTLDDISQIYSVGSGGYMKKTDSHLLDEFMKRTRQEFDAAVDLDVTGEGFIYQAFDYELSNHEYCITDDTADTLDTLGLTQEDIDSSPAMQHGLDMAIRENWRQ